MLNEHLQLKNVNFYRGKMIEPDHNYYDSLFLTFTSPMID